MELYTIEKNIPIPIPTGWARHGIRSALTLTVERMSVGDSIVVPFQGKPPKKVQGYISGILAGVKKRDGFAFCRRRVEGGFRVWRLS